jgi:hypothetical protein
MQNNRDLVNIHFNNNNNNNNNINTLINMTMNLVMLLLLLLLLLCSVVDKLQAQCMAVDVLAVSHMQVVLQ